MDSISRQSLTSTSYWLVPEEAEVIPVKIIFNDSVVFEATVHPNETVRDLMDFLDKYLRDEVKSYFLYTLAPRLIAKPEVKFRDMRSKPRRCLWFCGADSRTDFLFVKEIAASLDAEVFKCFSTDGNSFSVVQGQESQAVNAGS